MVCRQSRPINTMTVYITKPESRKKRDPTYDLPTMRVVLWFYWQRRTTSKTQLGLRTYDYDFILGEGNPRRQKILRRKKMAK